MKSIFLWGGVGVAVAAGIFLVLSFASAPSGDEITDLGPDYSQQMPYEGASHVSEGTEVSYQSSPPTSGSHWADPLRDGVYEAEKPDEALIHSLEHGRVWVSYKPEIGPEAVQVLQDFLRNQPRVILTPRAANETDIVLAAWMRLDTFSLAEDGTFDKQRVLDFIARYRDKGPEYVPQVMGKTYE